MGPETQQLQLPIVRPSTEQGMLLLQHQLPSLQHQHNQRIGGIGVCCCCFLLRRLSRRSGSTLNNPASIGTTYATHPWHWGLLPPPLAAPPLPP